MACLQTLHCSAFCCCCTLQAGVLVAVVIYTTIFFGMLIMSSYTITVQSSWTLKNLPGLSFAYGHATFIVLGIYHAFCGAYRESFKCMRTASFFMTIALIIYIAATVLSYISSFYQYACIIERCPDHVWMQDSGWRHKYYEEAQTANLSWKCLPLIQESDIPSRDVVLVPRNRMMGPLVHTENQGSGELPIYRQVYRHPFGEDTSGKNRENNISTIMDLGGLFKHKQQNVGGILSEFHPPHEDMDDENNVAFKNKEVIKRSNKSDLEFVEVSGRNIKLPMIGLFISSTLNILYIVFLIYIILTFIAYGNELRLGIPRGFSKDDWHTP